MPEPSDRSGRLQLLGEIARGGMGAVLKGRDVDLGRDLAVKVLLERHGKSPELTRRFVEEAQIAGQLQHPGVVPVYELGTFADRRPFFTMKLVKGRTLSALLEARRDPTEDRPRHLVIFEQVCQTMAYAHARGVIHRDLKPSNVMVGAFGEVQLMDWGLAKVLVSGGVADDERSTRRSDESVIRTVRSGSDADASCAGSILGTPAYMAPEQARGEVEGLDERADVFGLGAILCEILTGQPPYVGRSAAEVQRMAARADLEEALARLESSGVDAELQALARRCLAAEPRHRPREAGEVALAIRHHLDGVQDRLRRAELARVEAQARAEEEAKRRVLADRLASEAEARVIEERKRRRLTVALAASVLGIVSLGAGGWAWLAADRAARAASTAREVNKALDDAATLLGKARSATAGDLSGWAEATEAAKRAASILAQGEGSADLGGRVRALMAAVTLEHAEAKARAEATEKDRLMLERLDEINSSYSVHMSSATVDARYQAAFRDYGIDVDALDPAEAAAIIAARPIASRLAWRLESWGNTLRKKQYKNADRAKAARLLAIARAADPDPWRNQVRDALDNPDEDKAKALDALKRLVAATEPEKLASYRPSGLARALADLGDHAAAISLLRTAQRAHPDDFWINWDLGVWLHRQGAQNADEAIGYFRAAVALRPRSAFALNTLGGMLRDKGQLEEAEAILREAIRVRPDYGEAHVSLGSLLLARGNRDEAYGHLRTARHQGPDDAYLRNNIGAAFARAGLKDEAMTEYREAIRLEPEMALPRRNLAAYLVGEGEPDQAIAQLQEAVRLEPGNEAFRSFLARLLLDNGHAEDSVTQYHELLRRSPNSGFALQDLGRALLALGQFVEAREVLLRSQDVAVGPNKPVASTLLLRECDLMIALEPRLAAILRDERSHADATEHAGFASLCHRKRLFAASVRFWRDAFAAQPALADDLTKGNRYNAACDAALAGCGKGEDDPAPDEAGRVELRRQSLEWLRADLAARSRHLETLPLQARTIFVNALKHWRTDGDLAGIRDADELARLPEAERADWQALWAEVDAVLARARGSKAKS
jgi:serine/threonine-protein kinase